MRSDQPVKSTTPEWDVSITRGGGAIERNNLDDPKERLDGRRPGRIAAIKASRHLSIRDRRRDKLSGAALFGAPASLLGKPFQ